MTILQFAPWASQVEPAFWHALSQLKIDVLKLSSDSVPLSAFYSSSKSFFDRNTRSEIALASPLTLPGDACNVSFAPPSRSYAIKGTLKNFNTIEEFKTADKAALFNHLADQIWSTNDPEQLNQFLLLTFADLKKYKFYYWFAFPAFVAKPAWEIDPPGWRYAESVLSRETLASIKPEQSAFLLILPSSPSEKPSTAPLSSYPSFFDRVPSSLQTIGFVDPSGDADHPGWPLRNILTYLLRKNPSASGSISFKILCWRDIDTPSPNHPWRSKIGTVLLPSVPTTNERWTAVGWEKDLRGKTAPRMADLGSMMDPKRLADQATALNLKLMRWRILPSLDLESIAQTKCLLLGAGTLGCYVARTLMGWGVQKITLVDSAKVSFSNPVRQPLFDYEDCLNGGKEKAPCAAEKLKQIWPGVDATGISMFIPMPGHPIPDGEPFQSQARKQVETLEKLVDDHDVIFLLMDSRESRWLPTVLGTSKGKIVINAALGFDSYLVMRHGPRGQASQEGRRRLGCYYCNDIVAPADSLRDRTLDQMCTVTRPGLAPIASASAVELMVSLIQHPEGVNAPAPTPESIESAQAGGADAGPGTSILGLVPHQLRGFLAQFRNMLITGAAYDRCTGCSEIVVKAYEEKGFDFLLEAFRDSKYLERLTGLDELYAEGEAALGDVDWEEEEGDL